MKKFMLAAAAVLAIGSAALVSTEASAKGGHGGGHGHHGGFHHGHHGGHHMGFRHHRRHLGWGAPLVYASAYECRVFRVYTPYGPMLKRRCY